MPPGLIPGIFFMVFAGKTVFITGASRGIGKSIGLKLAAEGANIVIASKSVEENPKLGGTIFSAAEEMKKAGGNALPIQCDIRFEDQVQAAIDLAVKEFGGIDILVNNASAISLQKSDALEPKRYDLMFDINVRGTFMVSRTCIPHLKKSGNAHILNLSPPLNMNLQWFKNHLAYTISKYNMTMIALGLSEELKEYGIACNTLWPKTTIATAAVQNLLGGDALIRMSRKPEILADAAFEIFKKPSTFTGNSCIDENILQDAGITDLSGYSVVEGAKLYPDLFIDG